MAAKKPQADEGLDSLLGELDAMAVPAEPAADDLDSLLDDLGNLDLDEPGEPDDDVLDTAPVEPATEPPPVTKATPTKGRFKRPSRRTALIAVGLLASHLTLFALGHWLGGKDAPHEAAAAHGEAVAPLEGVMRHVGHAADLRVDGHLIFTTPEVRDAVLELAGGQSLADALTKFSRRIKSLGPVTRDGDLIEAKACNPDACAAEAFSLRYNTHTRQVWVCQTAPYAGGASLSYLYGEEGMEEVARCVDAGPMPPQRPVPQDTAEPAPQEAPGDAESGHAAVPETGHEVSHAPADQPRQLARPGRAPPAADHSAVD